MLHSVTAMKVGLIVEQLEQKRLNELTRCHPSVPQHMVPPLGRRVVRRKTTTALRQPAIQRRCRVPVTTREKADHRHYDRCQLGITCCPWVKLWQSCTHRHCCIPACTRSLPLQLHHVECFQNKRLHIKPAGKWDNDRSAGHCFLCHVYLRSGDELT